PRRRGPRGLPADQHLLHGHPREVPRADRRAPRPREGRGLRGGHGRRRGLPPHRVGRRRGGVRRPAHLRRRRPRRRPRGPRRPDRPPARLTAPHLTWLTGTTSRRAAFGPVVTTTAAPPI